MITEITAWVKSIVLVVLFATFLEFLLPASSMQRFVRVIMLALLNPLIDILHSRWLPEKAAVFGTSSGNPSEIKRAVDRVVENRAQVTQDIYRRDMARQIRALVIAIDGVSEARVVVDTRDSKNQIAAAIRSVTIYVQPGLTKDDTKMAKVTIASSHTTEHRPEISATIAMKIRRSITELVGLNANQIIIQRLN